MEEKVKKVSPVVNEVKVEVNKEVKKVLEEEPVIKAAVKLNKDKVEVNINPKKFLMEFSKNELDKLEKQVASEPLSEEDKKFYLQIKQNHTDNIAKYEKEKIEAFLVPLKYRDLQAIKDSVLEAVKYAQQFNWDDDIKLRAMIREEHTMTVYLALRKKDNINERHYKDLEEIAKEPDSAVDELYNLYIENFVLTEAERKNL